ncbi:MAG: glycosyl hydrolase [Fuerstiella sp.]|nr:glycosyl hydrolase [Fuerstiella sp.]
MSKYLPLLLLVSCSLAVGQEKADTPASDDVKTAKEQKADDKKKTELDTGLLTDALKFRSIGPAFMSGRIGDVAIDPVHPNTWYVAVASGGLWKTTNAGTTFKPIFDNKPSYSMGCVSIDPSVHTTVWLGTGENNGGRHIGFGDGVYVSHDSGSTWHHRGLENSQHVSKVLVDPRDSNVVFAASQGPLWSPGGDRGLFKSNDGGKSWMNVLSAGGKGRTVEENEDSYTGVTDVVFDPSNPDVMYVATHQRHRNVWAIINCGPETGLFKSTDGGESWTKLTNGLPGGDMGKISLQVSPQKSNVVYATIELPGRKGGFWRSEDHGASWKKTSDFVSGGTGPHYYQELWADPHRYGVLYQANNYLKRSEDNGDTWISIEGRHKHVDNHAVAFHPTDKDFVLVGCDGGVYRTYDYCKTWLFCPNLPLTQFYKVSVDNDYPFYNIAGGTQDNNSQYGPSATRNVQGIRNSDWRITIGGDGHDTAIDPKDPNTIYAESQQGHLRRFDRRTGESVMIQPQPGKGEAALRFNWDSPILISPHSNTRLYFASQYLHRSDDRGDSWERVSPDLSRNRNRYELTTMGRVHSIDAGYDLYAMSQHSNITSIAESPLVEGLLYIGTDDGLIQVSEDGGMNWRKIDRSFDVPEYFFVNDIEADLHDPDTVYACIDDHKTGDYKPYVVKSSDRGRTWELMVGNLPERHICWRIVQDHVRKDLFFLATEFGIFCTLDAGEKWFKLGGGVPTISFRDLEIQPRENDLVGASFGRSFYVLDDYSLLRQATPELFSDNAFHIFPIRRAFWYVQNNDLGGQKGYQGDSLFNAKNPDYGTVIRYYVRDGFKSLKAKRLETEAKFRKAGEDVPTPTFEELQAEEDEIPPRKYLEIMDEAGTVVARKELSASKGIHRVTWNFRYEGLTPQSIRMGPMVAPGTYVAMAYRFTAGKQTQLGKPVTFKVRSIVKPTLPLQDRSETIALVKEMGLFTNRTYSATQKLNERIEEITRLISKLRQHPKATPELLNQALKLKHRMSVYSRRLGGDELKDERWTMTEPGINQRLQRALSGTLNGTHGPTKTVKEQWQIGKEQFKEIEADLLKLIDKEMDVFEKQVDKAKVPRTTIELQLESEED